MKPFRLSVLSVLILSAVWPTAAQPQLGGFIEYDNLAYFESANRQKINGRNQVILQTELRHGTGTKASLLGSVELRYDQADPSRNRVFLDEAYMESRSMYPGDEPRCVDSPKTPIISRRGTGG